MRSEKGQAVLRSQRESGRAKEAVKRYSQTEKGRLKARVSAQTRRARMLGAITERFNDKEIFIRDNWCCGICKEAVDPTLNHPDPMSASLDHVVPLSRGGSHTRDNVQLAHLRCNLRKNDKLPEEFETYKQDN